ncbi:spermidine synthase [Allomyces macrogynus ATCC 38327]|uniref:Spermidine synthase n=1 Tax=Allomyces macrogynus (strain ATCC 38327) TaxID=578462 RepID=A0A0L0TAF1_ALLM3|nr:spermidine synthase [Allomyces macrogynus ATCC 38327]|eukprot:KNE71509.1 spermidine synthase [Allomyces macrogynus ATCC 38327]
MTTTTTDATKRPAAEPVEAVAAAAAASAAEPKRAKTALMHPNVKDGWFRETTAMWPGQAMSLEVDEILHVERSLFQDVLVFKSKTYGNVLVLDGVIQVTERDEMAYQEMIAHVPLNAHPNPRRVLVVGGGDGGVLREVVKHPSVESVTLCEIDEAVPRVSRMYLPTLAAGFDHPKVTVHIGDGFEFLKDKENEFDVIITDSSDPVGPAESLFQDTFFGLLHKALTPNGIICSQGECIWLHLDLISRVLATTRSIFATSSYAYISIPTYPCGTIGFILSSKEANKDFATPLRTLSTEEENQTYRYYNKELHRAVFQVPTFVRKAVEPKNE